VLGKMGWCLEKLKKVTLLKTSANRIRRGGSIPTEKRGNQQQEERRGRGGDGKPDVIHYRKRARVLFTRLIKYPERERENFLVIGRELSKLRGEGGLPVQCTGKNEGLLSLFKGTVS